MLLFSCLGLLAGSVLAAVPGNKCNADNCLRAVRATNHFPHPSSAKKDCSSFLRKTVTPCPITTTQTVTATATAAPSIIEVTDTITQSTLVVDTVVQSVTSDVATITVFASTSTLVASTEIDVVTSFDIVTSILARGIKASTCAAHTSSPCKVPSYASACSGAVRYSSACSCDGVTATTTTLAARTKIVTTTTTITQTPRPVTSVAATQTLISSAFSTETITTTVEVTDLVTTIAVTTFTATESSVLVIPTATLCPAAQFVALDGPFAGQFLYALSSNQITALGFTSNAAQATTFEAHLDGRFFEAGTDLYMADSPSPGKSGIGVLDGTNLLTLGYIALICNISPSTGLSYSATGILLCYPQYPGVAGGYDFYDDNGHPSVYPPSSSSGTAFTMGAIGSLIPC